MCKKKILIISAVFPPEPIVSASLSRDIAEELSKSENVEVLCPIPSRPMGFDFELNCQIPSLNYKIIYLDSFICPESKLFGRIKENISFGINCVKFIKKNHKSIKYIYINVWPLISQALIIRFTKKFEIPTILHVQDIYPESFTNQFPFLLKKIMNFLVIPIDKYALKNCSSIIAISNNMKIKLSTTRNIKSDKFNVVSNWQNEEDFRLYGDKLKNKTDNTPFTFMYLGNIGPLAGVDFIIISFVESKLHNCRLIVAGSGSKKGFCQNLSNSLNANNIEFWDVPDGKVPEIQAQADVMLLSVKKGGAITSIPSKLPAYMFSAKPIIACVDLESDTASTINNSNCGLVLEPENNQLLIEAMSNMSKMSSENLNLMGSSGYNYAIKNLSKNVNLKKILLLFKS